MTETKLAVEHREPDQPGSTVGPASEMYYQLSSRCADTAAREPLPGLVTAAHATEGIAAQLAGHVPAELRPASVR
jgi:hypothetical protein